MIKIVLALRRLPELNPKEFGDIYLNQHVELILDSYPELTGFISNLADEQELNPNHMGPNFQKSPYDLLMALHFNRIEDYQILPELSADREKFATVTDSYMIDEVEHWDNIPSRSAGTKSPGFKIIPFSCRKPGLPKAEFNDHYREIHSALAREHHPGIGRYVQNFVVEKINPEAPDLDAIAELHFAAFEDYRDGFYAHKESPKIIGKDIVSMGDLSKMHFFTAFEMVHKLPV